MLHALKSFMPADAETIEVWRTTSEYDRDSES